MSEFVNVIGAMIAGILFSAGIAFLSTLYNQPMYISPKKGRYKTMSSQRNPIAVAMRLRHGKTTTTMKDRRASRGGARNEQYDMLLEFENNVVLIKELQSEESDNL